MFKKSIKVVGGVATTAWIWVNLTAAAVAIGTTGIGTTGIGTGVTAVSPSTLAGDVSNVSLGISAIAGVVALGAITWVGIGRMWDHTPQGRADNKERLIDIFKGFGIVGLATLLVGFAAYLIQQATGGAAG